MRTLPHLSQFPLALLFLLGFAGHSAAQSAPSLTQTPGATATHLDPQQSSADLNELPGQKLTTAEFNQVKESPPVGFRADAEATTPHELLLFTTDASSLTQYLEQQALVITEADRLLLFPQTQLVRSFLDAALVAQSDNLELETTELEANEQTDGEDKTTRPGFLSGSATLTTNYLTRGISQTRSRPAVQGNLQYNQPIADDLTLYGGFLTSSVDFGASSGPNIELDWYVGGHYQISDRLSANVISYYFTYLGNSDGFNYDWWEIFPSLTYDFGPFSITGELGYSPNWFFETGDALHLDALIKVPITENLFVSTSFLRQTAENNTRLGLPDWSSWNFTVGYTRDNYTLSLMFSDTDIEKASCLGGQDVCDPFVLLSLTRFW